MTERSGSTPPQYYVPAEIAAAGSASDEPFDPNGELMATEAWSSREPPVGDVRRDELGAEHPGSDIDAQVYYQEPIEVGEYAAVGSAGSAAPPRWRLQRFVPRTLTARLVSGVVLLVVVVVIASGAATYAALGRFLTNRLNQQVGGIRDSSFGASQRCVQGAPAPCSIYTVPGGRNGSGAGSTVRGAQKQWLTVLDPTGTALSLDSESSDLVIMALTSSQRAAIVSAPNRYRDMVVGDVALRVTGRVISTNVGNYYEVVGLSSADETNTLHTLFLIELAIGGGAVLLALGATTLGVRLSLRPLHRVTTTARAVTAELSPDGAALGRRVPVNESAAGTEVGQLAESVNTLLGAVGTQFAARVESEQRMRQFMADASHELRTPLTSIRGYAELARLQRAFDGSDDDGASRDRDAEALARIESEGTRMSRLVEDLLTLARGDIGAPIESVPVYLAEVIEEAAEGARVAHPGRQIAFSCAPDLVTRGDHDQLLRVVRNLLNNAAVHTAPGRPIRVTCVPEGPLVVIRVIDSGPGLPPEQAAHVFERFWRSDSSRSRISGGSGLGLSIVASIVAAHGGGVWFDSSVEGGSTVTVSLPAYRG